MQARRVPRSPDSAADLAPSCRDRNASLQRALRWMGVVPPQHGAAVGHLRAHEPLRQRQRPACPPPRRNCAAALHVVVLPRHLTASRRSSSADGHLRSRPGWPGSTCVPVHHQLRHLRSGASTTVRRSRSRTSTSRTAHRPPAHDVDGLGVVTRRPDLPTTASSPRPLPEVIRPSGRHTWREHPRPGGERRWRHRVRAAARRPSNSTVRRISVSSKDHHHLTSAK
jgi:hypothetical protein